MTLASQAFHDDIIPLSEPAATMTGETVDCIMVGANTSLLIPISTINKSEKFWGPDAKEFRPERWLNNEAGLTSRAKEIQGYHHLLSFIDGPRICLGRLLAVAEFKVSPSFGPISIEYLSLIIFALKSVLSILIRNYVFDMRDGPETKIKEITTILPRPTIEGEPGYAMPMRVRRFGG